MASYDFQPPPPPSKWLYALVIAMTAAIIIALIALVYGLALTVQQL